MVTRPPSQRTHTCFSEELSFFWVGRGTNQTSTYKYQQGVWLSLRQFAITHTGEPRDSSSWPLTLRAPTSAALN